MPKYLSITVSGAVSLGCYEAGVLYEILEAIAQHNENALTKKQGDFIYVDVMTGASAGGMTTAIVAQNLLYRGNTLRDPATNPLYLPWVKRVSLDGLLSPRPEDTNIFGVRSMLSSSFIDEISKEFISISDITAPKPHPSIDLQREQFALGLALSNLDGIDYARPVFTGGDFIYTRYQDEVYRVLDGSKEELTGNYWEAVRQTAVASGAFPFAFAVRELARADTDFDFPWRDNPFRLPPTNGKYAYTDGGVFQNEPLGLAKNLVNIIGDEDQAEERFYLFVAPGAKTSAIVEPDPKAGKDGPLVAAQANFWNAAKALLSGIFQQARFHDWIQAEEVNDRVNTFNLRADELKKVLLAGTVTSSELDPASKALNVLLALEKGINLVDIRAILKVQFKDEYAELLKTSQTLADSWIEAILTLELAANIEDKDEMNIIGITATNEELACDPIFSFGGFFSEAYRQHDYDVGRNKAKAFLRTQVAPFQKPALGPIRYDPGADILLDAKVSADAKLDADSAAVSQLNETERTNLKNQIRKCVYEMMTQAGVPWYLRQAVEKFYILGKLNAWLKL